MGALGKLRKSGNRKIKAGDYSHSHGKPCEAAVLLRVGPFVFLNRAAAAPSPRSGVAVHVHATSRAHFIFSEGN